MCTQMRACVWGGGGAGGGGRLMASSYIIVVFFLKCHMVTDIIYGFLVNYIGLLYVPCTLCGLIVSCNGFLYIIHICCILYWLFAHYTQIL